MKKIAYWMLSFSILASPQLFAMESLTTKGHISIDESQYEKEVDFNIINVPHLISAGYRYPVVKEEYEKIHEHLRNKHLAEGDACAFEYFYFLLKGASKTVQEHLFNHIVAKAHQISLPDLNGMSLGKDCDFIDYCSTDACLYSMELGILEDRGIHSSESEELIASFESFIKNYNQKVNTLF